MIILTSLTMLISACNAQFGQNTCRSANSRNTIRVRTSKIPKKYRPRKAKGKTFFYVSKKQAISIYNKAQ